MQESLYTYLFKTDNNYYIYNSETSIFIEISKRLYTIIFNREYNKLQSEELNFFLQKKILIQSKDKYNFFYRKKIQFLAESFDKEYLDLVIIPTLSCNFNCPYCFEGKKTNIYITKEVENDIIKFIKERPFTKRISLTWYGGEPLIRFDKIKEIYYLIRNQIKADIVSQSLITNGFLINDSMLLFFKQTRLDTIQITLDGIKEHHNKTRYIKEDPQLSTYNIIISNIQKTAEFLPDCNILVRVNIDKNNEDDFFTVYNYLQKYNQHKNIIIYPGFIEQETKDGLTLNYNSIDKQYLPIFYKHLKEKGLYSKQVPQNIEKGCMANRLNSYIIGPMGEIYKCWNDVNKKDKIICYINQNKFKNQDLLYKYIDNVSTFSNSECKDCYIFPICDGGCGHFRYKNKFEGCHFNICSPLKDKEVLKERLVNTLNKES